MITAPSQFTVSEQPRIVPKALAEQFEGLDCFLANSGCPAKCSKEWRKAIWTLALQRCLEFVRAGGTEKQAARKTRDYLFRKAVFPAMSRDALLKAFNRKLDAMRRKGGELKAPGDGRVANGNKVEVPQGDIDRLLHSTSFKNGGRNDAAWREEYDHLSEQVRARYPNRQKMPRPVHRLLIREKVDRLTDRHQGKLKLRRSLGGIETDCEGLPSMWAWVVDDGTSNIEVTARNSDGSVWLGQPQLITVMDVPSRKIVGWAISTDNGPTAELVCEAVLDAIRTHDVPKELGLENGFVFGKALNVNGKEDEQGQTIVAGLAYYGCVVQHFEKMNPTGKSELEKSWDLLQRYMERHPGYTGRFQMRDAPEDFKREQRLIRSGKVKATDFRYTFDEFASVLGKIIADYNAQPQHGWLKGLSPDEAFEVMKDRSDPPIKFTPELEWMLNYEHTWVTVDASGVKFPHYGRTVTVRGGPLPGLIGSSLWAWVNRRDDSLVTFMSRDFTSTFTMEACEKPSKRERLIAPGSGVLAAERAKLREHERAIDAEYNRLKGLFGNPRQDLLRAIRNQPRDQEAQADTSRIMIVPKRMVEAGVTMEAQRDQINKGRKEQSARSRSVQNRAREHGIPAALVESSERNLSAFDYLAEARREHEREQRDASAASTKGES